MADLAQLEEQIVGLSLLEASALVKKLEERLGVSAAAAAPVAVAAAGADAGVATGVPAAVVTPDAGVTSALAAAPTDAAAPGLEVLPLAPHPATAVARTSRTAQVMSLFMVRLLHEMLMHRVPALSRLLSVRPSL